VTPVIAQRRGLQPERTALAWQRTAISASVAVLPLMLVDVRLGEWALVGVSALAGLVITSFAALLRRRVRHLSTERLDLSPWPDMVRVAAATCILAALGVVTALVLILQG
jgi:uncharacterized membrane protein YidH (DUF202 family)